MSRQTDPVTNADARRLAKAGIAYQQTLERHAARRTADAEAVANGGRAGMSRADQDAMMGRSRPALQTGRLSTSTGPSKDWSATFTTPAATAATTAAVKPATRPEDWTQTNAARPLSWTGDPAPLGNQYAARQAGAFAASPAPYASPTSTTMQGQANRALSAHRNAMIAAGTPAAAAPIGRTLSPEQGDAILGARPVSGATQYGTASVRTAAPNESLTPATTTDAGVSRQDWQTHLRGKHPAIWEADSPENQAFVAAYRANPTGDPLAMADEAIGKLTTSANMTAAAEAQRAMNSPEPVLGEPSYITVPDAPVVPSSATVAGQGVAGALKRGHARGLNPIVKDAAAITRTVVKGVNTARDFAHGIAGTKAPHLTTPDWASETAGPAVDPFKPLPVAPAPLPTLGSTEIKAPSVGLAAGAKPLDFARPGAPATPPVSGYAKLWTPEEDEKRRRNMFAATPFSIR
jgi:hypothetical protein